LSVVLLLGVVIAVVAVVVVNVDVIWNAFM